MTSGLCQRLTEKINSPCLVYLDISSLIPPEMQILPTKKAMQKVEVDVV